MPYSVNPVAGVKLDEVYAAASGFTAANVPHKIGQQVWAEDGKLYVFAKANGAIPASTAVCTVAPATFLATSAGGAYASPAVALVVNDYAWFGKASV